MLRSRAESDRPAQSVVFYGLAWGRQDRPPERIARQGAGPGLDRREGRGGPGYRPRPVPRPGGARVRPGAASGTRAVVRRASSSDERCVRSSRSRSKRRRTDRCRSASTSTPSRAGPTPARSSPTSPTSPSTSARPRAISASEPRYWSTRCSSCPVRSSTRSARHVTRPRSDGCRSSFSARAYPNLPGLLAEARSYSERLFQYTRIDRLNDDDAAGGTHPPSRRGGSHLERGSCERRARSIGRLSVLHPAIRADDLERCGVAHRSTCSTLPTACVTVWCSSTRVSSALDGSGRRRPNATTSRRWHVDGDGPSSTGEVAARLQTKDDVARANTGRT